MNRLTTFPLKLREIANVDLVIQLSAGCRVSGWVFKAA